jgi:hypothetical protein
MAQVRAGPGIAARPVLATAHSHSMVAGGFVEIS